MVVWCGFTAVVVYDIPHLSAAAIHHPVMAVKRHLIAVGEGRGWGVFRRLQETGLMVMLILQA